MRLADSGEEVCGLVVPIAIGEEEQSLHQFMGHPMKGFHFVAGGAVSAAPALRGLGVPSVVCFVLTGCQPAMRERTRDVSPDVRLFSVIETVVHAVRRGLRIWL